MYFACILRREISSSQFWNESQTHIPLHFTFLPCTKSLISVKNYSFLCRAITLPADLLFLLSQKSSPSKRFEERHIFTRQHIEWCRYYYTINCNLLSPPLIIRLGGLSTGKQKIHKIIYDYKPSLTPLQKFTPSLYWNELYSWNLEA